MYQLLGIVALINRRLHTETINGVPLDLGVVIFGPIAALFSWAVASERGSLLAWILFGFSAGVCVVFGASYFRHNIIFRRSAQQPDLPLSSADVGENWEFLASGRFELWQGDRTRWHRTLDLLMSGTRGRLWFVEIPARLEAEEGGRFAVVSHIDASQRILGIAVENKRGMWFINGSFETLAPLNLESFTLAGGPSLPYAFPFEAREEGDDESCSRFLMRINKSAFFAACGSLPALTGMAFIEK